MSSVIFNKRELDVAYDNFNLFVRIENGCDEDGKVQMRFYGLDQAMSANKERLSLDDDKARVLTMYSVVAQLRHIADEIEKDIKF